jgi:hypothetical protein
MDQIAYSVYLGIEVSSMSLGGLQLPRAKPISTNVREEV